MYNFSYTSSVFVDEPATATDETPEETEEVETPEEVEVTEKLGPNSKVKIIGTDNIGEIQSIDGDVYMVLINGKVDKYKEEQLQNIDDKIKAEEEEEETETEEVKEENTANPEEGKDTVQAPEQAFVKGKITIDFGDFRK